MIALANSIYSPESLGLVCASIYILLLIMFIPFPFSNSLANLPSNQNIKVTHEGLSVAESLHHQVSYPKWIVFLLLTVL